MKASTYGGAPSLQTSSIACTCLYIVDLHSNHRPLVLTQGVPRRCLPGHITERLSSSKHTCSHSHQPSIEASDRLFTIAACAESRCLALRSLAAPSPKSAVAMDAGRAHLGRYRCSQADCYRPCKNRKIKCGEERPKCQNCERQGEACDYSIRLNWEGRSKRKSSNEGQFSINASSPPLKRETSDSSTSSSVTSTNSTVRGPSPNPLGSFMTTQYANSNSSSPYPSQPSPFRDSISTAQLSRIKDQASPYPSPAETSLESPPLQNGHDLSYHGHHHSYSNPDMPPPFQITQYSFSNRYDPGTSPGPVFGDHKAKKIRTSPSRDRSDLYQKPQSLQSQWTSSANISTGALISPPAVRYLSLSPSNGGLRIPPTPTASSLGSEDLHHTISLQSPQPTQDSSDYRRLSVKSLLSEDPGTPVESGSSSDGVFPGKLNTDTFMSLDKTKYGLDRGFPDLDLPRNNDQTALNGMTPDLGTATLDDMDGDNEWFSGFGFGFNGTAGFQEGAGYYTKPVTVSISKSLEPLPDLLRENPMNLLYFHHFLNHTARILVPHDCSENPFKSILPQSESSHLQNTTQD